MHVFSRWQGVFLLLCIFFFYFALVYVVTTIIGLVTFYVASILSLRRGRGSSDTKETIFKLRILKRWPCFLRSLIILSHLSWDNCCIRNYLKTYRPTVLYSHSFPLGKDVRKGLTLWIRFHLCLGLEDPFLRWCLGSNVRHLNFLWLLCPHSMLSYTGLSVWLEILSVGWYQGSPFSSMRAGFLERVFQETGNESFQGL